MAQAIINSNVIRDKSKTLNDAAMRIVALYDEMLAEVNSTASRMQGTTITSQQQQFASMQPTFEAFGEDMQSYSAYLETVAENFEAVETSDTNRADELNLGKIF